MKTLFVSAALLALASAASAGEVPDGSQWAGGGGDETITVSVTDDPAVSGGAVFVSASDSTGTSNTTPGAMGANGTDAHPTASESGTISTPGGKDYRAHNGKMQRKGRDGTWKDMKRKKKKSCARSSGGERLVAGQAAPHDGAFLAPGHPDVLLLVNERAPWDGMLCPGEEITSLPGGP